MGTRGARRPLVLAAIAAALLGAGCGEQRKSAKPQGAAVVARMPVGPRLVDLTVRSPALGRNAKVRLLTPKGWRPARAAALAATVAPARLLRHLHQLVARHRRPDPRAPRCARRDAGGWRGGVLQRLAQRRPRRPAAVGDVPPEGAGRSAGARVRRGPPARDRRSVDGRVRRDVLRRPPPGDVRRRGFVQRRGHAAARRRAHPRHRGLRGRRPRGAVGLPARRPQGLGGTRPADARAQAARHAAVRLVRQRRGGPVRRSRHDRLDGGVALRPERRVHPPAARAEGSGHRRPLRAGTHTWPYWERELHRALPLLLGR